MVPLIAGDARRPAAETDIAPGNIFQNSAIPYKFANVKTVCHRLETTPFRPSWIRTPGRMQNTYANECFIDELAAAAEADPIEFRLKYLDPADKRGIEVLEPGRRARQMGEARRRRRERRAATSRRAAASPTSSTNWSAPMSAAVAEVEVDRATGEIRVHAVLRRPRLRADHQSGRAEEPDRRQRHPDREPHADRGGEVRPLAR